jgi:hypothetical protein
MISGSWAREANLCGVQFFEKGVPYEWAIVEADKVERKERWKSGDVRKLTRRGLKLPDGIDVHERPWKKLKIGVSL